MKIEAGVCSGLSAGSDRLVSSTLNQCVTLLWGPNELHKVVEGS